MASTQAGAWLAEAAPLWLGEMHFKVKINQGILCRYMQCILLWTFTPISIFRLEGTLWEMDSLKSSGYSQITDCVYY